MAAKLSSGFPTGGASLAVAVLQDSSGPEARRTYSALTRRLALIPSPVMASFTPLRYPIPYPTNQAATAQPAMNSQGQTAWYRPHYVQITTRGEVTSSGSSHPNASSPSGPATCRGANPTRILGAPARSPGRRRARPRSLWLGGTGAAWAETAARATKPANVARIVRISASKGDAGGNMDSDHLHNLNAFWNPQSPCRWPQAALCGEAGSGLR